MRALAAVLFVVVLAGCGGSSPTGPDALESRLDFTFQDATPAQQAITPVLWEEQKTCTGYASPGIHSVLIQVRLGGFLCVAPGGTTGIWAAGCTEPGRIQVSAPQFEMALAHEFIHYVDLLQGRMADFTHSGPVWTRCDQRNR